MDNFPEAGTIYRSGLATALSANLEAHSEMLSLLKPFFPSGWSTRPTSVGASDASDLASEVGRRTNAPRRSEIVLGRLRPSDQSAS